MELVFEIGCEDLPARFVGPSLEQLKTLFNSLCLDSELLVDVNATRTVGTPRRLALLAQVERTIPRRVEQKIGPSWERAFADGQPTRAAVGFSGSLGLTPADLRPLHTEKGIYASLELQVGGGDAREHLPGVLQECVRLLHFPKTMRWGAHDQRFARPLRWLVAVADGEILPVHFAGVSAGNYTFGHRFAPAHGHAEVPSRLLVTDHQSYLAAMEKAGIVVDPGERRRQVSELVHESARKGGGRPVDDAALLDEVTHLVEQPNAVLVEFDAAYLDLPDEVLLSSMRAHQRYFGILDDEGGLKNACVVVYNTPVRDPRVVAAGNLRVLKARLDDAKFFWENDLSQPLDAYRQDLDRVLWLNRLGSLRDKSDRIAQLAERIAVDVGLGTDAARIAQRAGHLSKADLVTSVVYEFPDLQGVMGREYALRSDEGEAVATAIYEQYLPRGAEDELPTTNAGACVAIAEKLDSLVGCFLAGLIPTSTADPYGLRRAAIGVIRVLQGRGWRISLEALVDRAAQVYDETDVDLEWSPATKALLLDFVRGRLENQLVSDYPTDVVRAVLAVGLDDVTSVTDRVAALSSLRDEPVFEPLATGFKRVVNILRKQASEYSSAELQVNEAQLAEDAEKALHAAATAARVALDDAISQREWPTAVRTLASLREPVDTFFDTVMVMTDDAELKRNRVALLFELQGQFLRVADLSVVS